MIDGLMTALVHLGLYAWIALAIIGACVVVSAAALPDAPRVDAPRLRSRLLPACRNVATDRRPARGDR